MEKHSLSLTRITRCPSRRTTFGSPKASMNAGRPSNADADSNMLNCVDMYTACIIYNTCCKSLSATHSLLTDKHRSHTLLHASANASRLGMTTHHSTTDTHASHKHLLLFTLGFGKSSSDLSRTCATQWVTHGNGTSDRVDLLVWELEVLDRHDSLRCKGLGVNTVLQRVFRSLTSLISKKSTSSLVIPAFSNALGIANAGPILRVSFPSDHSNSWLTPSTWAAHRQQS